MRNSLVIMAGCLALAGCCCCRGRTRLRVVSRGYESDTVVLWVANGSMHNEDDRPRIERASVTFDSGQTRDEPKIEVFNSKYGWTEHATFPASNSANTARIKAIVTSRGRRYTVTQDWSRSQASTATGRGWIPQGSSISERAQPGESK